MERQRNEEKKRKEEVEAKWMRLEAEKRKEEVLKNKKLQDVKVSFFSILLSETHSLSVIQKYGTSKSCSKSYPQRTFIGHTPDILTVNQAVTVEELKVYFNYLRFPVLIRGLSQIPINTIIEILDHKNFVD